MRRQLQIACVINIAFENMIEGLADWANAQGNIQLRFSAYGDVDPFHLDHPAVLRDLDGILIEFIFHPQAVDAVKTCRLPVVDLTPSPNAHGLPHLLPDHREIGRVAARHLVERGFRHFAYYHLPRYAFSDLRLEGVRDVMQEIGGTVSVYSSTVEVWGHYLDVPERRAMEAWLTGLPRPVGIVAATDARARNVLDACRRIGLMVPEQAAVIGVDNNLQLCATAHPSLSSVMVDNWRQAYEGGRLMLRLLSGEPPPAEPILIPPRGVAARRSTEMLATEDPEVATALHFIRQHAGEPITIDHVVDATHIGRRNLELRFKREVRRTLQQEIDRMRIERAKQLLTSTDLGTVQIAARCGFSNASRLSESFRRHTGVTPRDYRRTYQRR